MGLRVLSALLSASLLTLACRGAVSRPAPPISVPQGDDGDDDDDEDAPPAPGKHSSSRAKRSAASAPCAASLDQCPSDGCAHAGSPHALLNRLKRRTTDAAGAAINFDSALPVAIDDLVSLQARAEAAVGSSTPGQQLTHVERDKLRDLHLGARAIGEGTAVRVVGYIAPAGGSKSAGAHEGGAESVNCRVPKPADAPARTVHDFHIPVTSKPGLSECDGVVVEMIPQGRGDHPTWTLSTLKDVAAQKQLVMFVGPLFYDNEHVPNPDCGHLISGQPKRASLWEVHPVVELYVCTNGTSCQAGSRAGWKRLD